VFGWSGSLGGVITLLSLSVWDMNEDLDARFITVYPLFYPILVHRSCMTVIHLLLHMRRSNGEYQDLSSRDERSSPHPAFQRVHVLGKPAAVPTHT
jgi:hypothetical protein